MRRWYSWEDRWCRRAATIFLNRPAAASRSFSVITWKTFATSHACLRNSALLFKSNARVSFPRRFRVFSRIRHMRRSWEKERGRLFNRTAEQQSAFCKFWNAATPSLATLASPPQEGETNRLAKRELFSPSRGGDASEGVAHEIGLRLRSIMQPE